MKGFRLLHIFSPCPPGHKSLESDSIKISRLAVDTKVFPLYEVENGVKYNLSRQPKDVPVSEYARLQGRFKHLGEKGIAAMQERVDYEWNLLMKKIACSEE